MKHVFCLVLFASNLLFCEVEQRFLLITGCGHSGTKYASRFFSACGLSVSHESSEGKDGIASWGLLFGYYRPFLHLPKAPEIQFDHIFHQVRAPLDVIQSWVRNRKGTNRREWKFVRAHIPEIYKRDSLIVHAAKYWYYWNKKAESIAELTYRLEEMDTLIPVFEECLGVDLSKSDRKKLISKKTNAKKHSKETTLTWQELKRSIPEELYENIVLMAERYGYLTSDQSSEG